MNKYKLIQDDDCHWYIIPYGFDYEFEQAIERYIETGEELPEWVVEVDGPHTVFFENYTVL